ncbi:MAG TPA: tetratricopeptide repeat protein [Gemmatimonadaceae bacterium]|nr:tetratricopeptide repeat protein [Gemmatimonadaceae bacterium]
MRGAWSVARGARSGIVALLVLCAPRATLHAQRTVDDATEMLRSGKYQEAASAFAKVQASDTDWSTAQRGLVRSLMAVGKYDDAEAAARRATSSAKGAQLWNTLGQVLYARGKTAEAEQAFTRAGTAHASDSLTAALNLAILHYERGDRDNAMKEFDHFIDVYNGAGGSSLSAADLTAVAIACRYLGSTNPQLFKDALKAFDRAIQEGGDSPEGDEARIALGEMFLEKYNSDDAQKTFDEVLRANASDPRALLGAAKRRFFDGASGADSLVARALKVNPNYPAAHVFAAELHLDLEEYADAAREVDRALQVDPALSEALAVRAAVRYLIGDAAGFETAKRQALTANPRDAELYNTLAELSARVRQYKEAADFARQAVALDAKSWRGFGLLGMNQLRLGQIAAGQKSLATSFAGDPYNVWIKNTLDLLDTFKNYDEIKTDHFVFMIDKDESALLEPYIAELGEAAYTRFASTYQYTPPPPIRIEVYRSHADFSVRTVGLAGLGALGVSFGTTLAFDSPAAKDAGPFNWGSTVWHELAHTFTLGSTDHRIPRWLSEGLSVYEEHRARTGWGFDVTPAFLDAYRKKKLVPVSRMNDGFMHPAYPEQVMFSYYQASLVCDLIARDYGEPAIQRMLQAYKAGQTTDDVFKNVLKTDIATFDRKFDAYLRERFSTPLAGLDEFRVKMGEARALMQSNQTDAAVAALERAKALFPQYGGDDSPTWYLAQIYIKRGDTQRAAAELKQVVASNEANYAAQTALADALQKLGDTKGAAAALSAALYVNPFELPVHQRLAELAKASGDRRLAVRERRAIVALAPVDRPEALYQLAVAYREAGDSASARRTILRALEDAPNFEKAQTLLLVIHEERSGGRKP